MLCRADCARVELTNKCSQLWAVCANLASVCLGVEAGGLGVSRGCVPASHRCVWVLGPGELLLVEEASTQGVHAGLAHSLGRVSLGARPRYGVFCPCSMWPNCVLGAQKQKRVPLNTGCTSCHVGLWGNKQLDANGFGMPRLSLGFPIQSSWGMSHCQLLIGERLGCCTSRSVQLFVLVI